MENKFIRVDEVADELGVSRPYAYKLIRQLNEELKGNGCLCQRQSKGIRAALTAPRGLLYFSNT